MKTPSVFLCVALLAAGLPFLTLHSADGDKSTSDKAREMLDKLVNEAQKAAGKVDLKTKELWARTKENLHLTKEDYLTKATSALGTMSVEIKAIAESDSGVVSRDYFKMRIEALKLHLDYCKRDLDRLKESPDEEEFRVKQKKFDRTLGSLSDNIELAKQEAGV